MTAPAATAAPSTTPGSNVPDRNRPVSLPEVARIILRNCGVALSPNKIARLCIRFEQRVSGNGFDFFTFLANSIALDVEARRRALADPDVARAIEWADPTGEQAVNNVMRTRGY